MALKRSNAAAASKEKKSFKVWWDEQPAARRKNIMLLSGLVGFMAVAFLVVGGSDEPKEKTTARGKIENAMLPGSAAKDLGVSGLTNEVRSTKDQNRELENKVARLEANIERFQGSNAEDRLTREQKLESEMQRLSLELETMKAKNAAQGVPAVGGSVPPGQVGQAGPVGPAVGEFKSYSEPEQPKPISTERKTEVKRESAKSSNSEFYIPSGTIIQGVLLTGVDAPTSKSALKDPVPVLARVKDLAILPNLFRADVRECFVLMDAVGDLASERAMMRSSNISCVRRDRSVVDVPIQGYLVGEDGKAGMRGTLVSKQGAALAKATMAGLADGLSQAYSKQSDLLLPGTGGSDTSGGSSTFESGIYGGASSALDRIAQYYLDLADQLHPVVEIESGRKFTLVVVRGRTLAPLNSESNSNSAQGARYGSK